MTNDVFGHARKLNMSNRAPQKQDFSRLYAVNLHIRSRVNITMTILASWKASAAFGCGSPKRCGLKRTTLWVILPFRVHLSCSFLLLALSRPDPEPMGPPFRPAP